MRGTYLSFENRIYHLMFIGSIIFVVGKSPMDIMEPILL